MEAYGSTIDGLRPVKSLASGRMPWRYLRSSVASHHPVSLASMRASQAGGRGHAACRRRFGVGKINASTYRSWIFVLISVDIGR